MPFVVGAPRSGTTLLRMMLDAHPDLCVPAETGFLSEVLGREMDADGLFRAVTGFVTWPDAHLDPGTFRAALAGLRPFTAADGVRAFYRLCAARFGKPRGGDKTPGYTGYLGAIRELLPEARFVHIIRDGRDVAASVRACWFRPGDAPEALARDWCGRVRMARVAGRGSPDYLEMRYEDLVRDPRPELERVCRFLDLRFDPAVLAHDRHFREVRAADVRTAFGPDGAVLTTADERLARHRMLACPPDPGRIGRWREALSPSDAARFEAVAGELLAELGYEIARPVTPRRAA